MITRDLRYTMRPPSLFPMILTLLASGGAVAAEENSAPATAGSEDAAHFDEVVVTAQRRAQNLQEVPVAITALTSADIDRLDVRETLDLITLIPNLVGNNNVG